LKSGERENDDLKVKLFEGNSVYNLIGFPAVAYSVAKLCSSAYFIGLLRLSLSLLYIFLWKFSLKLKNVLILFSNHLLSFLLIMVYVV